MTTTTATSFLFDLALMLGDDALVLGHRLSEWSSKAPMLEEDIALSNLALDLIGQARVLYTYAGQIEGKGRDEDKLAYFRVSADFRNCLLVELPNGDFAETMLRQLFFAAFMHAYYDRLQRSKDVMLAGLAGKAVKEMAYHVRHAGEWVIRLGDGTEESRRRSLAGLDFIWGYTGELFEMSPAERALASAGIAPDRGDLKAVWEERVGSILNQATLPMPPRRYMQTGGRSGRHTEHLDHLLAVMQVLPRAMPDARW